MNLKEIEDTLNSCINCWDRGPWDEMEWLISEVKKKLPIKSHHCQTTHTACECILDNMNKLEEENTQLKAFIESIWMSGPVAVCNHDQEASNFLKTLGEK